MHLVLSGTVDTISSYLLEYPVTRGDVPLRGCAVSVPDEGGKVPVLSVEWDTMISIPGIKYCLLFAVWD